MSTSDAAPTALIVHAHPEPHSFSSAQMTAAAQALRDGGYRVDVLDLYRDAWAPTLGPEEFAPVEGPFKPQDAQMRAFANRTLDAPVQVHLDRLLAADLLVLSFPLWWFSLPAILKGWVDRVFVMGGVFGGDYGIFGDAALVGKRAMLLFTTGGSSESFQAGGALGSMDDFLFHIHRGMLEFVGYQVLDPVVTYAPARMSDQERTAALDRVRESVTSAASVKSAVSAATDSSDSRLTVH